VNALHARRAGLADSPRDETDELRREIERLRAFVELRAQAQENLVRAMLAESAARAAEALEARIQIAAREAMAFAEHGLEQHEATLRALGRRVAELGRETPPVDAALPQPAAVDAYCIGAGGAEAADARRIDIRDDSEDGFLADLGRLPILPGGAARIVAAHVVEFVPTATLTQTILPHWRSRLAPGGELVVVTLDGPAFAAALARGGDFASLRRRLGADGAGRPPRNLFAADELARLLREAGFAPDAPAATPPHELRIVARAGAA
jgi:hypothetical protein